MHHLAALGRNVRFVLWVGRVRLAGRRRGQRVKISAASAPAGVPRLTFRGGARGGTLEISFGRGSTVGRGFRIDVRAGSDSRLSLGDGAYLEEGARIHLYGANVEAGSQFTMRPGSIIHAYGRLLMGELVTLSFGAIVHCGTSVTLGDRSGVAERGSILDSDHVLTGLDGDAYREGTPIHSPVVLEENVLVFANAVVMRGVTIGKNSAVAANSVVRMGSYPRSSLIAGSPARVVRDLRGSQAAPQNVGRHG
jgi:acetyltransferase-like isoleucine patch superfamily enzyme